MAVALVMALTASCGGAKNPDLPPVAIGGSAAVGGGGKGGGGAGGASSGSGGQPTFDLPMAGQAGGGCFMTGVSDNDHDGFTIAAGDCNDCDPAVNPGAYDFQGNGIDEDCSGTADDEAKTCDVGLPVSGDDALDAARALGLCRQQHGQSWGVVAARWVFPNGEPTSRTPTRDPDLPDFSCSRGGAPTNPQSRGLLTNFGANVSPREGATFVALSTGVARAGVNVPADPALGESPSSAEMCTESLAPAGFPKDSPACPDVTTAQNTQARDAIALELEIKTPTNARALAFDFDFYTYEWPEFVCSDYNDFFVALLKSSHPNNPLDENISFDKLGNPVSVNNGFVEVCDAAVGLRRPGGKSFACALGTSELIGTGFDVMDAFLDEESVSSHAATGWLSTTAAIVPGETIRMRFAVWDMFDEALDSTVLLDHFTWTLVEPTAPVTERPPR